MVVHVKVVHHGRIRESNAFSLHLIFLFYPILRIRCLFQVRPLFIHAFSRALTRGSKFLEWKTEGLSEEDFRTGRPPDSSFPEGNLSNIKIFEIPFSCHIRESDHETLTRRGKSGGLCKLRIFASVPCPAIPMTSDPSLDHTHAHERTEPTACRLLTYTTRNMIP